MKDCSTVALMHKYKGDKLQRTLVTTFDMCVTVGVILYCGSVHIVLFVQGVYVYKSFSI